MEKRRPSGIILSTKRSGTNFTHDVLSYMYKSAVQEPLGLHNEGPMSFIRNPLNPWRYSSAQHVSSEYGHTGLKEDPYGSFLSRNFISWLREGSKLIKETDFLYLGWLYASVPLKTVVLERDPRDCIASFKRGNLYNKWGYAEKMESFATTIKKTPLLDVLYGGIGVLENFTTQQPHRQLALYYAISAQEIVRNTHQADKINITYEELIERPEDVFRNIGTFLGLSWGDRMQKAVAEHTITTSGDRIHGTFRSSADVHSYMDALTDMEAADIRSIFKELGLILEESAPSASSYSVTWDSKSENGEQEYKVIQKNRAEVMTEIQGQAIDIGIDEMRNLKVGKYLVSNEQYSQFLIWLQKHSIPITVNGVPLFYNDRPQSKIRVKDDGVYIDRKFTDHPVVFVNWIAAAIFCKWINGRLPTATEWDAISSNSFIPNNEANVQQIYGGTVPVNFFPPDSRGIHDLFGNAGVWVDSIIGEASLEAERRGIGWNHSLSYNLAEHTRPYWLGSAGVGIRPVFGESEPMNSDEEVAAKIRGFVGFLTDSYHPDIRLANSQIFRQIRDF